MSKKKKSKLQLNLKEGERYRHRVAMVNEEGGWNQHEPNAGMARMFVIMLLIHVLVIGGIIIYDFVNGTDTPSTAVAPLVASTQASTLPPSAVNAATLDKVMPIEDYATYEWRSGDSLPVVAEKLGVSPETLIKLNMLDRGAQIEQNTILRYPRRPVVKAVALGVAGANGETAKAAPIQEAPAETEVTETVVLTPPGGNMSLEPTLLARLTPAPIIAPGEEIIEAPPAAASEPVAEPEPVGAPEPVVESAAPTVAKTMESPPEVPKALPISPDMLPNTPQAPNKAVSTAAPATRGTHLVKSGDTLYGIAMKHRVSVAALQKVNNITKPELLREGMKLVIPSN